MQFSVWTLGRGRGNREVYFVKERKKEMFYGTKRRKEVCYVAQKEGKKCSIIMYGRDVASTEEVYYIWKKCITEKVYHRRCVL